MKTLPKTLLHVTHIANLDSILSNEIEAREDEILIGIDERPGVNFSVTEPFFPYTPARYRCLVVNTDGLEPDKFVVYSKNHYRYLGSVPARNIERVAEITEWD